MRLKRTIARYAGLYWVAPMAVAIPLSLLWFLAAASGAGVPVAEVLGAASASPLDILRASVGSDSGYPMAQRAVLALFGGSILIVLVTLFVLVWRDARYGLVAAGLLMAGGLAALGGAEWIREDLRKPYVIGGHMLVNGIRLPAPPGAPRPPEGFDDVDRFSIEALNAGGILSASVWHRAPAEAAEPDVTVARGHEVFRLLCSSCHTIGGYQAIRPLVRDLSPAAIESLLRRLATPVDGSGRPSDWSNPDLRLTSWRGRRMPPFVGTAGEAHALAVYLSGLGGYRQPRQAVAEASWAERHFADNCLVCHDEDGVPIDPRGRSPEAFEDLLRRLPEVDEMMPAFEGTDAERRAMAAYLAGLSPGER